MQRNFCRFVPLVLLFPQFLHAQAAPSGSPGDESKPVALEPLVVTAVQTKEPLVLRTDPRAPAQPVPAHDGADMLKNIPGFSVIRKGGTDGDPVLRGLAGSRLGIQLEDQCVFGGCGNRMDPPTAYVFPTAYDRVTIIKGPQTVLHGPGNSAGVVLFERDVRRPTRAESGAVAAGTVASFGRFDGMADVNAGNALIQTRGIATWTQADDYKDGEGRQVHSAYERWSTNVSTSWTPDSLTRLEIGGAISDGEAAYADRMMDGVKFDRTNYGFRFRRDNLTKMIRRVEARYFHSYVDHVMDNFSLRTFVPTMMMPARSVSNPDRLTSGGLAQAELAPWDSLVVTAGVDTQSNTHTVRVTSNELTTPYESLPRMRDGRFTQYGAFAEGRYSITGHDRIVAGARQDWWTVVDSRRTVAISMVGPAPNPSFGHERRSSLFSGFARYEHDLGGGPVTFFAGLGRVQRFPDYWELIKNESTGGVSALGTRPETTRQWDAGLIYGTETLEMSLSLFASDIRDYILVQSGFIKPSGLSGTRTAVVTRNVDVSTLGGEASVAWRFAAHWKAEASVAYVRGENDTDSLPLAQLPPLETKAGLVYAAEKWSAGGSVRGVAAQNRFARNQGNIVGQDIGASAGFAVFSLNASIRMGGCGRVSAGVDNILDKTYAEHISRAGGAVAGFVQTTRVNEPGRTCWLKVDLRF